MVHILAEIGMVDFDNAVLSISTTVSVVVSFSNRRICRGVVCIGPLLQATLFPRVIEPRLVATHSRDAAPPPTGTSDLAVFRGVLFSKPPLRGAIAVSAVTAGSAAPCSLLPLQSVSRLIPTRPLVVTILMTGA